MNIVTQRIADYLLERRIRALGLEWLHAHASGNPDFADDIQRDWSDARDQRSPAQLARMRKAERKRIGRFYA